MLKLQMGQYQKNLLLGFLLTAAVAVMLFMLFMTLASRNILFDSYDAEKQLSVEQVCQLADETIFSSLQEITRDFQLKYVFTSSSDLRQLAEHGYRYDLKAARQLCKAMQELADTYNIVSGAALYFPVDDCVTASGGFATDPSRYERYDYLKDFYESPQTEAWLSRRCMNSSGVSSIVMTYMKKIVLRVPGRNANNMVVFSIDVSSNVYLEKLNVMHGLSRDELFIHDEKGQLLLAVQSGISGDVSELFTDGILLPDQMTLGGQEVLVSQKTSAVSGWTFTLLTINNLYNYLSRSLSMITTFSLVMLALLLVVAVFLSRRLYQPLNSLLNRIGAGEFDARTDELEVIDKSFHDLNTQLEVAYRQASETQWYALLGGPVDMERYLSVERTLTKPNFYVLVVAFDHAVRRLWLDNQLRARLDSGYLFNVVPLKNSLFAIILNTDYDDSENTALLRNALTQIATDSGLRCWAGLGDVQDALNTLSLSYHEAMETMEYRFLFENGMFLTHAQQCDWADFSEPAPLDPLTDAIRRGNVKESLDIFDQFSEHLVGSGHRWSMRSIQNAVGMLYYGVCSIPNRLQMRDVLNTEEFSSYDFSPSHNLRDTLLHIRLQIETMSGIVRERAQTGQNSALERIRYYIDQNLGQDLSLSELSRIGGLNVSYVSTQFKKYYGIGIVQYINQKRLECARGLLSDSDMNVDEVARSVGFQNTSYFIKRFSLAYNVTPKNYKLQNRNP